MELQVRGYKALSEFILQIDYWFDWFESGKPKNKPCMEPYREVRDERLQWLASFPGSI